MVHNSTYTKAQQILENEERKPEFLSETNMQNWRRLTRPKDGFWIGVDVIWDGQTFC